MTTEQILTLDDVDQLESIRIRLNSLEAFAADNQDNAVAPFLSDINGELGTLSDSIVKRWEATHKGSAGETDGPATMDRVMAHPAMVNGFEDAKRFADLERSYPLIVGESVIIE